jgi:hypothetical protein
LIHERGIQRYELKFFVIALNQSKNAVPLRHTSDYSSQQQSGSAVGLLFPWGSLRGKRRGAGLPSREGKRYEGKRTALFLHPRGVFEV